MAITYQDILPDPNNPIGAAGQNTGTVGPGYKTVSLISSSPIMKTRTNSGRIVARAIAGHSWKIKIGYNPMTRLEFEPIYNFLLNRRGGLKPFYVSLPQYRTPQDSDFASYAAAGTGATIQTTAGAASGATSVMIDGLSTTISNSPEAGDLFTITSTDINHLKTYRITQVETNTTYASDSARPATNERLIHFIPGLQKATAINSTVKFHNPLIRVILSTDVQEYSLNTNNLYSFSLALEEALP